MTLIRILLSLGPVLALASFALGSHSASRGAAVYVNGAHVLTYRSANASARAMASAALVRRAGDSRQVLVGKSRRAATVRLGGISIASVSRAEAKASGVTPAQLAAKWASNLRNALALPPIQVVANPGRVPQGGTRELQLVGSRAHLVQWRTNPPGFVAIKRSAAGVMLQGKALGTGKIVFSAGEARASLIVDVLPLAAVFPQRLSAHVSGSPAMRDTVAGSLETAVRAQLRMQPDAKIELQIPPMPPLAAGQARVVDVLVKAEAPRAFASEGVAQVTVRNLGLGNPAEGELWYSNHPEILTGPGLLMRRELASEHPVRLLYHHINESPQGLYVQVEASNSSKQTARVLVIPGDAEPSKNPVLAGIVAAERFLRRWLPASGEVVEVPPGARVPIALRRLAPKDTMSGLCSLWLLEGGPEALEIKVHAQPPATEEATLAALINHETPWRFTAPFPISPYGNGSRLFEHVYPDPFKTEELKHAVGGRYGFVRIGQNPIERIDQNGALDGNFGVLYRIATYAENATDQAADLEVAFEASAGYSGALFVLNGEVIRTPLMQPKTSVRILRMHLAPGAAKRFDLLTLPLSGSSYPATIVMRPIELGNRPAVDLSQRWANKL